MVQVLWTGFGYKRYIDIGGVDGASVVGTSHSMPKAQFVYELIMLKIQEYCSW